MLLRQFLTKYRTAFICFIKHRLSRVFFTLIYKKYKIWYIFIIVKKLLYNVFLKNPTDGISKISLHILRISLTHIAMVGNCTYVFYQVKQSKKLFLLNIFKLFIYLFIFLFSILLPIAQFLFQNLYRYFEILIFS